MIWHNLRYPLFCPGAPSNVAGLGLGTLFCNRHNVCYRTFALSTDLLSRRHRSALSCCASSFSLNLNLFYGNFSSRKQWTQWMRIVFRYFCDSTVRRHLFGWQQQKFPCVRPCCTRDHCMFLLRPTRESSAGRPVSRLRWVKTWSQQLSWLGQRIVWAKGTF